MVASAVLQHQPDIHLHPPLPVKLHEKSLPFQRRQRLLIGRHW